MNCVWVMLVSADLEQVTDAQETGLGSHVAEAQTMVHVGDLIDCLLQDVRIKRTEVSQTTIILQSDGLPFHSIRDTAIVHLVECDDVAQIAICDTVTRIIDRSTPYTEANVLFRSVHGTLQDIPQFTCRSSLTIDRQDVRTTVASYRLTGQIDLGMVSTYARLIDLHEAMNERFLIFTWQHLRVAVLTGDTTVT